VCRPHERLPRHHAENLTGAWPALGKGLTIGYLDALHVDRAVWGVKIILDLGAIVDAIGVVIDADDFQPHVISFGVVVIC